MFNSKKTSLCRNLFLVYKLGNMLFLWSNYVWQVLPGHVLLRSCDLVSTLTERCLLKLLRHHFYYVIGHLVSSSPITATILLYQKTIFTLVSSISFDTLTLFWRFVKGKWIGFPSSTYFDFITEFVTDPAETYTLAFVPGNLVRSTFFFCSRPTRHLGILC